MIWFATIPHGILIGDDVAAVYDKQHDSVAPHRGAYYRDYKRKKYAEQSELFILRRLRHYYLTRGTTPKPWSRLAAWCEAHGLAVDSVLRTGVPEL